MPEYARFAGMRCEIQIQTILNHAWAEMAHDTIYKAPTLSDFGGRAFDGIKSRLHKVARKYLLPAGYEFQKIAHDFQRLTEGKALFDGDALKAIVEAVDNNVRAEALETFSENVLPLYDDLPAVYPEIIERLVAAADLSRVTPPTQIETPYGALPAKVYTDIVKAIANILTRYRYIDVEATFGALRTLYGWAISEDDRKPLLKLGQALAKHEVYVWREHGSAVQSILVASIEKIDRDERHRLATLLIEMLGEMLGVEVSGTTNSSSTVTFHSGGDGHFDAGIDVGHGFAPQIRREYVAQSGLVGRALPTPVLTGSGSAGRSEHAASQPVDVRPPGVCHDSSAGGVNLASPLSVPQRWSQKRKYRP